MIPKGRRAVRMSTDPEPPGDPEAIRQQALNEARNALAKVAKLRKRGLLALTDYRHVPRSALLSMAANWCGLAMDALKEEAAHAKDREAEARGADTMKR